MTYALSNSRHLQIANRITHAAIKKDNSPEIKDLTELLKIDTKQPNADFLRQFRELKNTHPFINDLCQRRGFFGSIGYAFRGDDYRAERYKAIIDQLKQGSYIDQDNNKISYFGTATNLQKSVCEKVEEIKNGYLAKTYNSTGDEIYKNDKIVFEELKNFNENVGFKPSKAMSTDIQTKDDNDMFIWKEFVKANPEYSSLSSNNQDADSIKFTINVKSVQELKQDVLKKLNLPEITKLFTEDGNLNESVGKVIKQQQQQQAATKIQRAYRVHVSNNLKINLLRNLQEKLWEKIILANKNKKDIGADDYIPIYHEFLKTLTKEERDKIFSDAAFLIKYYEDTSKIEMERGLYSFAFNIYALSSLPSNEFQK